MNKLQEANDFLDQPIVVSSVFDELRAKQHLFETSDNDKIRRFNDPHHRLLRDLARINASQYTFFFQLTIPDTLTKPQNKLDCLFLRKTFGFNCKLIWTTLDQNCL